MIEQSGNLWELVGPNDALVITTNGDVRKNGTAVMGRGIALQATQHDPTVADRLGAFLKAFGNQLFVIHKNPVWISFPVKHHWNEPADLELIRQSAKDLPKFITMLNYIYVHIDKIYLPRPGCGNGRRKWEEVKPIIEPYLDDRFIVVTYDV